MSRKGPAHFLEFHNDGRASGAEEFTEEGGSGEPYYTIKLRRTHLYRIQSWLRAEVVVPHRLWGNYGRVKESLRAGKTPQLKEQASTLLSRKR